MKIIKADRRHTHRGKYAIILEFNMHESRQRWRFYDLKDILAKSYGPSGRWVDNSNHWEINPDWCVTQKRRAQYRIFLRDEAMLTQLLMVMEN